jgi:tripartite-type tricarboxylate transporter receptor subunit TctC
MLAYGELEAKSLRIGECMTLRRSKGAGYCCAFLCMLAKSCGRPATAIAVLSLGVMTAHSPTSLAQGFPERPVKLITGGAPGSVPDTVVRPLAEKLAGILHQPMIVENHPGAGGILAMDLVAKARPNGYTIGVASIAQMVFNLYLFEKLPYDPARDLTPVIKLVAGRVVIAANPSFPANSVGDLIALAKAQPGTINYAVPQLGAPPHIFALELARQAQIDMVAVPFRNAQDALARVVSGDVPIVFEAPQLVASFVQAGKLKALAVIGRERDRLLPDTPTLAESGLNIRDEAWIGLVVPASVSPPIIKIINSAVSRALSDTELKQRFETLGWHIEGGSPEDFASAIREDNVTWERVIRTSGLRLQ